MDTVLAVSDPVKVASLDSLEAEQHRLRHAGIGLATRQREIDNFQIFTEGQRNNAALDEKQNQGRTAAASGGRLAGTDRSHTMAWSAK